MAVQVALVVLCAASALQSAPPKGTPAAGKIGRPNFLRDVAPLFERFSCNASECHGAVGGGGGLRLSLFGADPALDYQSVTKAGRFRYINFVEPQKSLLLVKAAGGLNHGGKRVVPEGSPQYKLLLTWIERGAPYGSPQRSTCTALRSNIDAVRLKPNQKKAIHIQAVFADGSKEDVTGVCRYQVQNSKVATVSQRGEITARSYGETSVIASYLRKYVLIRVTVPQELPFAFPKRRGAQKIDDLVFAKLKELGIPPSPRCSDAVFLRRVYLDVLGTLPSAAEVRRFLGSKDPQKRAKLVDGLLSREEFADFWALKWGDLLKVKSEYPSNLWPNAVQAYWRWIRNSIARNKPYDRFVRELVVSSGSNFRDPPVNFYRAFPKRTPQYLGSAAALLFMGMRLGCAQCHAHPTEPWTLKDSLRFAAFFAGVAFKRTDEWKEEIVYFNPRGSVRDSQTGRVLKPALPGGQEPEVAPGEDPRAAFARWLTSAENPYFARNIANRLWFWLLGKGIVNEVDDLRPSNPPSNPALLSYLAEELRRSGYDLRHLFRLILTSQTYQRSSEVTKYNSWDDTFFSHYLLKRLTAEELLDLACPCPVTV